MKKLSIIVMLFFNLIPYLSPDGKICVTGIEKAFCQEVEDPLDELNGPDGPAMFDDGRGWGSNLSSGEGHAADQNGVGDVSGNWNDEPDPNDPTQDDEWGYPGYEWFDFEDLWDMEYDRLNDNGPMVPSSPDCYITINGGSEQFRSGSKAYFVVQPGKKAKLEVTDANGQLSAADYYWEINNAQTGCRFTNLCKCDLTTRGWFNVKVKQASTNDLLVDMSVIIYSKPVVFFHKEPGYNGGYGFDEEGWQYDSLRKDYDRVTIDSIPYMVNWMSVLPNQNATIRFALNTKISDPNFSITFKGEANFISINQSQSVTITGSALNSSNSLTINCKKFTDDTASFMQKPIYAISNTGDTVGQLNISCHNPHQKRLTIIYVNTGKGYRNTGPGALPKDSILFYLNNRSHNQIFRQWVLNTALSDTLDLTNERVLNLNNEFDSDKKYPGVYVKYYSSHKGVRLTDFNTNLASNDAYPYEDSRRNYYLFVSSDTVKSYPSMSGITNGPSATSGLHYSLGTYTAVFGTAKGLVAYEAIDHELGHALSFRHTFWDSSANLIIDKKYIPCPMIPYKTTMNFMDYGKDGMPGKFFFIYQWKNCF